jgi:PAS domain S-box-containing protein
MRYWQSGNPATPPAARITGRWVVFLLAGLLALGALGSALLLTGTDQLRREDLLQHANLMAQAINPDSVRALSGTKADLSSPSYQRLKQQFMLARQLIPTCRFLYLLGRKPDGTVCFYVDSEPPDSKDCSPPGQSYDEASAVCRRVFDARLAVTEGPVADRWGNWISAFVPLSDPATGQLMAVLGMDVEAGAWRGMLARAALPPMLFALALVLILLLAWRLRRTGPGSRWRRYVEPAAVFAAGSILALGAAWSVQRHEVRSWEEVFQQLAVSRTDAIRLALERVRDTELESLARFCEVNDTFSATRFHMFAQYLTRNPTVRAWEWIPVVPAAETGRFTAEWGEALGSGLWQRDAHGQRISATGREVYYPVAMVAPRAGNARALGYDLGSESLRRAALEDAMRSGLASATDPITLVQETGQQKGLLLFHPVYRAGTPPTLRGFALAALYMDDLLRVVAADHTVILELALQRPQRPPIILASTWPGRSIPTPALALTRPICAFGKVFAVTAIAGPRFMPLSSQRAGWLTLLGGVALAGVLAWVTHMICRGRAELQRLVDARTAALSASLSVEKGSQQRLDGIIKGTNIGTWEWNIQTGATVFNERWAEIIGYTLAELAPVSIATWGRLAHPDDWKASEERLERHFKGELDYYEFECRMRHRDGRWIWVLDRGCVSSWSAEGRPLLMAGTHQDITVRKEAEEAIRHLSERLELANQAAGIGVWDWDVNEQRLVWDAHMYELYGVAAAVIPSLSVWEQALHPEDRAATVSAIQAALRGGAPFNTTFRICRPDGSVRYLRAFARVLADEPSSRTRMIGVNFDVTAQKTLENQLRAHDTLEALLASISARFINLPASGTDRAIQESLGEIGQLVHVDRVYVFMCAPDLSTCANTHEWCSAGTAPQRDNLQDVPSSALPWWSARMRNFDSIVIPDVRQMPPEAAAEQELLAAQSIQSLLVVPMVWAGHLEGFIGFDSVRRQHTWDQDDITPLELLASSIINALKRKQSEEKLQVTQQSLRELNATLEGRVVERTRQLQEVQAHLYLQDKMASIGQLAAGLAHEINNPVSFVATNFATLEEDVRIFQELLEAYRALMADAAAVAPELAPRFAEVRRQEKSLAMDFILRDMPSLFEESREGFRRVTSIINSVRSFARKDEVSEFTPYSLNKGVEDTLVITRNAYKYRAEIQLALGQVPDIPCVPGQINQVLLNLIVNASQALASEPDRPDARGQITIRTWDEPAQVVCEVADNGPGIPPGLERQIFDPFFTTKPPGEGTGLGLSISYGIIVTNHGGTLTAYNQPAGGACFRLTLPHQPPVVTWHDDQQEGVNGN